MAETTFRGSVRAPPPAATLSDHDVYLFREGTHTRLYEKMGAHQCDDQGEHGVAFAVWAPNAESVSVIGDFNGWERSKHLLARRDDGSGIWHGFIAGVAAGERYKYHVASRYQGYRVDKGDPTRVISVETVEVGQSQSECLRGICHVDGITVSQCAVMDEAGRNHDLRRAQKYGLGISAADRNDVGNSVGWTKRPIRVETDKIGDLHVDGGGSAEEFLGVAKRPVTVAQRK